MYEVTKLEQEKLQCFVSVQIEWKTMGGFIFKGRHPPYMMLKTTLMHFSVLMKFLVKFIHKCYKKHGQCLN